MTAKILLQVQREEKKTVPTWSRIQMVLKNKTCTQVFKEVWHSACKANHAHLNNYHQYLNNTGSIHYEYKLCLILAVK